VSDEKGREKIYEREDKMLSAARRDGDGLAVFDRFKTKMRQIIRQRKAT